MEIASIKGEARQPGNRHANERLRHRGLIPAVIYGHQQAPETVALSLHDVELALEHMAHVVRVQVDGGEQQYLIKDIQFDHLQKTPIHLDLMRVDVTERVRVRVPIELRGTPIGIAEGGTLTHIMTELEVECPLLEIPSNIRVSVAHLALNQMLHAREVAVPEGITVLSKPEDIVAIVHPPRGTTTEELAAATGAAAVEGGAEPEVISRGKAEEAGEESGA